MEQGDEQNAVHAAHSRRRVPDELAGNRRHRHTARLPSLQPGIGQGRRHAWWRAPASDLGGHDSAGPRQEGGRPRRPLCRNPGTAGGYYLIDVPSLDEAIDWASKCPAAQFGSIEVRPIWPTRPQ
ncbi:MAG: YciI family protein [Devosia sp.]